MRAPKLCVDPFIMAGKQDTVMIKANGFGVTCFHMGTLVLPLTNCVILRHHTNSVSSSFLIGKVGA